MVLAWAAKRRRTGEVRTAIIAFAIEPTASGSHHTTSASPKCSVKGAIREVTTGVPQAIASNADSSQGHSGLAMVAIRQGDRKTAIARWERAVALQPSNFDALYDLSVQLAQDGQLPAAKRYMEQFVRTAPRGQYAKDIDKMTSVLAHLR